MSQRLDVRPIFTDHWDVIAYAGDGEDRHIAWNEAASFAGVPIAAGLLLTGIVGADSAFLDFTLKLALLLMPLMLNLLFTLYRCMQDEQKASKTILEETTQKFPDDPSAYGAVEKECERQRRVFVELCSHVLYTSLMCFALAALCGILIIAKALLVPNLSPGSSLLPYMRGGKFLFLLLIYTTVVHILMTAALILRKTYLVMRFSATR